MLLFLIFFIFFKNKPAIKLALDKLSPYYVLHRAMLGAVSRNNAIAGGLDHCPQGMAGDFPWLRSYLSCGLYPDCCLLAYALAFRAANEKTL